MVLLVLQERRSQKRRDLDESRVRSFSGIDFEPSALSPQYSTLSPRPLQFPTPVPDKVSAGLSLPSTAAEVGLLLTLVKAFGLGFLFRVLGKKLFGSGFRVRL